MQMAPDFGNTRWDKRLSSIDELIKGRNGGLFYPTICGLLLNKIFDNFAIGKNKNMTENILNSNKEFKRKLIRAFYDDEGSVGKNNGNIRLYQDNKKVLLKFQVLLMEFNIKTSSIKTYIKRGKERYYFSINGKDNFIKFRKEIGFTSTNKRLRVSGLISH